MKRLIFLFALLFSLGSAAQVFACSCVANIKPCERYTSAAAIFVGKAVSVKTVGNTENPFAVTEFTTFEIEEIISGTKTKQIVVQNRFASSCDVSFTKGEKYLIFANGNEKEGFGTNMCSGNKLFSDSQDLLDELRNLPKAGEGGKIFGEVFESIKKRREEYTPMPGVEIKIREIGGKRNIFNIATDSKGEYEINVPAGKYKLAPAVPAYATLDLFSDEPIIVKDRGCTQKNFSLHNKSRISGKVVDSEENPVSEIRIELISLDEEPAFLGGDGDYTDEKGRFSLEDVPAGRYTLSVNFTLSVNKDRPFAPTYYPNASKREDAAIIDIGLGQSVDGLVFRLPPRIPVQKVYGKLILPDGGPAVGMTVNLQSEDGEWNHDYTKTDENGDFELNGFAGKKYRFSVEYYGEDDGMRDFTVKKSVFTLDKNTPPFRLILEKKPPDK